MNIDNKFMQNLSIVKKSNLNDDELSNSFEIIKLNMLSLGLKVESEDKDFWCNNLKALLKKDNFCFFLVYMNGEIVGFIELMKNDDIFYISELQLSNKVKRSKTILKIIKFLFESEDLKEAKEVQFSILKNNLMSNKTFTHLGGKIILETEKKYGYSLSKTKAMKYLSKFS